jgi:hypothetical protein
VEYPAVPAEEIAVNAVSIAARARTGRAADRMISIQKPALVQSQLCKPNRMIKFSASLSGKKRCLASKFQDCRVGNLYLLLLHLQG